MKACKATFVKKNGEERLMRFVRLDDLPREFLNEQIKGTGRAREWSDGRELVWDLDNIGFRVFNWDTIVGEVEFFEATSYSSNRADNTLLKNNK